VSTLTDAVSERPGAGRRRGQAGPADSLAGVRVLTGLAFRRDRIALPVWVYALTVIAASGGFGIKAVYKTTADRLSVAATVQRDPALSFLYGQLHGSSVGAIVAWRYLSYAALGAGLMTTFLVVRHSRADEDTGRAELVGSTAVGRNAPLAVAMLVATTASLTLFVLTTALLALGGLGLAGSIAFAAGELGCGLVFVGIAAVGAQVSGTAGGARGIAITVLAAAFLLRGVGDSGGSHGLQWLTWLSPIGWAELIRPYDGERWWILALPAAAAAAGVLAAFVLAARRDQGAGLLRPRPGPAAARWLLAGPVAAAGLAWRLQRAALAGWTAGFLLFGIAIGVVGKSVGQLIGVSGAVNKALREIGGQSQLTNAYLAACMSLAALVAAGYAVSAVLRLRSEEQAGRSEPLLAGPVSRLRWAGSQLAVVLASTIVVMAASGLGFALGFGGATSDVSGQVPRLLAAGLVQVPAAATVAAVAMAGVGLLPRWSAAAGWTAVAVCAFIGIFGPVLNLPQPVLNISPFTHVPKLPGGALTAAPLIWLAAAALALTAAGLAGLRRRDIG
jgi:ABC-2 type transport system permease protein